MYIPKYFQEEDKKEIKRLINQNPFALLICCDDNGLPMATHTVLQLLDPKNEENMDLWGHISRANPQKNSLKSNSKVLVVFSGAHSYISPSWYEKPNVPTWNYLAVHLYGEVNEIEGNEKETLMQKLMNSFESNIQGGIEFKDVDEKIMRKDLSGIFCFRFKTSKIEAVSKLSQNRDRPSYENVIKQLSEGDEQSKQIAEEMKKRKL